MPDDWFWGWLSFAGLYRDLRGDSGDPPGLGPGHARPAGNWETGDDGLHHPYQDRKTTDRSA
jgi:hypothetical protein